ncbi:hypothetical protein [Sediminibacterium soli]|uniref:hypothetical protein n=1 Tax=Sediminibacterium soli TaxID=2698829 RepID=UPI00137B49DA|nr:hypothetical protein [Sediminibacterium soli]NCI45558.1 hypothetical protein [Sediminibacterium soli]
MTIKPHISSPLTASGGAGKKMDALIDSLREEEISAEEIAQLQQRFEEAISQLPAYRETGSAAQARPVFSEDSLLLVCRHNEKIRLQKKEAERRNISNTFRVIVSLLIIMLGFAMIILPTPPSFEIYTLFLFNDNDGFTLMDLISLVIVFAGIYALVTAVYRQQKNY